jgi:hypothetical protein
MRNLFTSSVRWSRRSSIKIALLASMALALGGASADAQILASDNYYTWNVSTYNNPVFMKFLGPAVPSNGIMTVQYTAWKPGGPYNCNVLIYLYDATAGYYTNVAQHRAAFYETAYYAYFYVQPGHTYYAVMYMTEAQAAPSVYFYTDIFQIANGYAPFGILID